MNAVGLAVGIVALLALANASALTTFGYSEPVETISVSCPVEIDVDFNTLTQLRERVISKNSKLLVKLLSSNCVSKDVDILNFNEFLKNLYSEAVVRAVYIQAVDVLFAAEDVETVAARLWQFYRKGNLLSYRIMLETQLYLYLKNSKLGSMNDTYLLNVGYYFFKAKEDPLYTQLDSQLRADLTHAINRLPSTLRQFYFEPDFCLYNKGYSEYMYVADGMYFNSQIRYIFNWVPGIAEMSQGAWLKYFHISQNATNAGELPYKLSLKGRKFGKYMYMDSNYDNLVAAWEPGTEPDGALWSLQFLENALVFEQNGALMCASEKLYRNDAARRFIYGYDDEQHSPSNEFCQWSAVECPLR